MKLQEFQFGQFTYIWLALLVIAVIFFQTRLKKSEIEKLNKLKPRIIANFERIQNPYFAVTSLVLFVIVSAFIFISILRPQYGYEIIEGTQEGVDIVIAADVSDSMLVEDVKPDRLQIQRTKITDLVNLIQGDRIALVSFAGASFIETPLTLDYGSISSIIDTIGTDLVPLKGSNFDSVAGSAINIFNRKQINSANSNDRSRAMIIFSDGEFEEGTLEVGLKSLIKNKISPYLIVIGSEQGGLVPKSGGFKMDGDGKPIISKANFQALQEAFGNANGKVIRATVSDLDLKEIYHNNIKDKLRKDKLKYNNVRKWNEYYQIPLVIGMLILFYAWRFRAKEISAKLTILFCISLFNLDLSFAQSTSNSLKKGYELYESGDFKGALSKFSEIEEETFEKHMAVGNTYYRLGDFANAEKEFGQAQSLSQSSLERARALFNSANSSAQLGNYKKALDEFEQAKKENPKDNEVDTNIEYIKKLIEKQEDKKDNQQQQEKEEDSKSDENDQGSSENDQQEDQSNSQDSSSEKGKEGEKNDQQGLDKENKQSEPRTADGKGSDKKPSDGEDKKDNSEETRATTDQLEYQLESLDENTDARNQYRFKKALEQLEREKRNFPSMDW